MLTGGIVLTIDGNGQTINGKEKEIFYISNGTSLVLKNITITNATGETGGAIYNNRAILTISNSTFTNNKATYGGAIYNLYSTLNISGSTFTNNQAGESGGAIYDNSQDKKTNVCSCNFTNNSAINGAVIIAWGAVNLTGNTFKQNTATSNKETINLNGFWNGECSGNSYVATDIHLDNISLRVKDNQKSFTTLENVVLNLTIQPTNINYYKDFSDGIKDITLYINNEKNATVEYANYTLKGLKPGEYNVYFTSCNQQSNTVKFTVTLPNSEISTDKNSYDYYDGINNEITLNINDDSGEKGNVDISVMDDKSYTKLLTYPNMKNGSTISLMVIKEALKKQYGNWDSCVINLTYYSDYVTPSSTNFTLNIIKQRNTSIVYDILNNTEGNVQINITVIDSVYKSPIKDASIEVTGSINKNTTSGVIHDDKLTAGNYTIKAKFKQTGEYLESDATINFTVVIDKDKKIDELEEQVVNLTEELNDTSKELDETNTQISKLNNTVNNLTDEIDNLNKKLDNLTEQINELINKPKLNTTITISPIQSQVGSFVQLSANITDQNNTKVKNGRVLFKINGITLKDENGNTLYAYVSGGVASISYKVQSVWMKNTTTLQAVYSGSDNYNSSRADASGILNISKGKATITLDKDVFTAKSGQSVTLRARVVDSTGAGISGDKVVFKLNGKTLTDEKGNTLYARVADGEAVLEYTIPSTFNAKNYTLTAVFGGNYYERTETNATLNLEKKGVIINTDSITTTNANTTIKATITDEKGVLLVTSTKLTIKINGKTILTGVNSTDGKVDVSFTTTLRSGMYELLIISGENGIYKEGRMTTVLKI